ncbi:MAG: tRNA preQ1(34) S-adenosylmethionine ribosyltransferase-isomerase QueA [Deltaproteobacteria bacterium]|nr:tRNA preQ1(34) S-adenosylmethionine ribosyltransferase-isomerase QueA [Deltaproteobacteria bacterium]
MTTNQDPKTLHQKIDEPTEIPLEFLLSTYSYHLPPELIAHTPVENRDQSKLLRIDRNSGELNHFRFFQLPELLSEGDVLVINETKVMPASLKGRKLTGGTVALLVIDPGSLSDPPDDPLGPAYRSCIFKASGKLQAGSVIEIRDGIRLVFEKHISPGKGLVRFPVSEADFPNFLEAYGSPPLPPYIKQDRDSKTNDKQRYQTVYSKVPGSVAAPTAGLHFTDHTIETLEKRGIAIERITLHVGPGTFTPIRTKDVRLHKMETETYHISDATGAFLEKCIQSKRRIIAVGSTCLRALEAAYEVDKGFSTGNAGTNLFILPGYKFKVVSGMVTNFHLPGSTLLTLICALAGIQSIFRAYETAILNNYRFYSYGDACLIL